MRSPVVLVAVALVLVGCSPTIELTTNSHVPPAAASGSPGQPTSTAPTTPSDSPSAPTPTAPPIAPVGSYVLGDSISLGVGPRLARLGYPVTGRVGQSVTDDYLTTYLSSPDAQEAPAWVLMLGTNNPGDAADVDRIDGWLDLLDTLRLAADGQDVYWVTPYRDPRYSGGLDDAALDDFNAELVRQAAARPWLHVIDFASEAAFHPEWFDADGAHLHPDDAGNGVLAAMIAGPDAVPLLSPAPLETLDGPGSISVGGIGADDGPAHPTTRPSSPRTAAAGPPASAATSADQAVPAEPTDGATGGAQASNPAPAAQPEFSPAG